MKLIVSTVMVIWTFKYFTVVTKVIILNPNVVYLINNCCYVFKRQHTKQKILSKHNNPPKKTTTIKQKQKPIKNKIIIINKQTRKQKTHCLHLCE